jgi:DNA-binding LacI/PurR family transcriptional regulator
MCHIRDRGLQPGDRLGTEEELCRAYHVSRVTVRQALSLLQEDGLIVRKKRAGTIVAAPVGDEDVLSDWRSTVVVLCSNKLAAHIQDYAAFATVLRALESVLGSKGYRVQILGLGDDDALDRMRLRCLARQPDVSAICAVDLSIQPYANNLPDVPVVATRWSTDPSIISVGPDWAEGARACVAHLIDRGHRDIAMLCGAWTDRESFSQLVAGYRKAMADAGLAVDRGFLHHCCPGESVDDAVREVLTARVTKPTAVFAENSFTCEAVLRVASSLGMELPRDLSLVGFGQNVLHLVTPAKVTAYVPDNEAIGRRAAELIVELIDEDGGDGERAHPFVAVDGKLVEGDTVAPPSSPMRRATPGAD